MVLNSTQRTLIRSFISLKKCLKVHDHFNGIKSFEEAPASLTIGIENSKKHLALVLYHQINQEGFKQSKWKSLHELCEL